MDVVRIVLVSPGDVLEEREKVAAAIDELNRGIAADRGVRLELSRWETDAHPGFHADGPQGLIDPLIRPAECDCVIGIFWKRFGTPSLASMSGTEHELKQAIEGWRSAARPQIMVYFCDRPASPETSDELDQWKRVLEFKASFRSQGGLYWHYSQPADLERLVRSHLTNWLPKIRPFRREEPNSEAIEDRKVYIERYSALIDMAQSDVIIMSDKFHRSAAKHEAKVINESLHKASKRGVRIRMLNNAGFDRLPGALELAKNCEAEVRFDPGLQLSDMNFVCCDSYYAMISLRTSLSEGSDYRPSRVWTEFRSTQLAAALRQEFERRWRDSRTRSLWLLMRELLPGAIREMGAEAVSRKIGLDLADVRTIAGPPLVVCLIGRPGAGKTTVADALLRTFRLSAPGFRVRHVSDLEYVRGTFQSGQAAGRYEATEDGGFFITDATLYRDALLALAKAIKSSIDEFDILLVEFARKDYVSAFELLREQGIRVGLIVYLDVPLQLAQERNRMRAATGQGHFVSEREMQETFQTDDLAKLQETCAVSVLTNEDFKRVTAEQAMGTVLDLVRDHSLKHKLT